MSLDVGHAPTRRRLSPWTFVAILLVMVAIAGTLSWIANGRHDRSTSSEPQGLRHADLTSATLVDVDLAGLSLEGATLERTDLADSDLRSTDLSWTEGSGAVFQGSCLRDTTWEGSSLQSIDLDGVDLRGADFRRSSVTIRSARRAIADDTTLWGGLPAPAGLVDHADDESPCD